ncbi:MAG: outer membrane protein assembly factor BamB family protein [Verrucomicrobiales bacterium]
MKIFFHTLLACTSLLHASDSPQASGAGGNFQTSETGPSKWSVAFDQNIAWKTPLPEAGQSTPVISKSKVFFITLKPVEADAEVGKDIIARCCDTSSGKVLWEKEIIGKHPLQLSGCFSDSSARPAVTDGEHVVFVNASSGISCFTLKGDSVWKQDFFSVGRGLPFLHDGKIVSTRQIYTPEKNGHFPHKYANAPKEIWTQLQAPPNASLHPTQSTERSPAQPSKSLISSPKSSPTEQSIRATRCPSP